MLPKRSMHKNEIADKIGISSNTLRIWLNYRYFQKLQQVNYSKNQKILTWNQIAFLNNILDFLE